MPAPYQCVVDANIFVRGTLSPRGASGEIVRRWLTQRAFQIIVPRTLLEEIYRALSKPKLVRRYQVTEAERRRLIRQVYVRSILVSPSSHVRVCRDPNDDYLIEAAILGKADFLVTEDPDLFDDPRIIETLRAFNTQIIRAAEFLRILK